MFETLLTIISSEEFTTFQLIFVIVVGTICVLGILHSLFRLKFEKFVKDHIIDDYHGPDACIMCNKTSCDGCTLWKEENNDKIQNKD